MIMKRNKITTVVIALTLLLGVFGTVGYVEGYDETQQVEENVSSFSLEINVEGSEYGTILMPGSGVHDYTPGEEVEIFAYSEMDGKFTGWTGEIENLDDPQNKSTSITMDDHYTITANFQERNDINELWVWMSENGEVIEPGVGFHQIEENETIDLVVEPDDHYRFEGWTGDTHYIEDPESKNTTLDVEDDIELTPFFVKEDPEVTVLTEGEGNIELNDEYLDLPYQEFYEEGDELELSAEAGEGYRFYGWSGDFPADDEELSDRDISIEVEESKVIRALFLPEEMNEDELVRKPEWEEGATWAMGREDDLDKMFDSIIEDLREEFLESAEFDDIIDVKEIDFEFEGDSGFYQIHEVVEAGDEGYTIEVESGGGVDMSGKLNVEAKIVEEGTYPVPEPGEPLIGHIEASHENEEIEVEFISLGNPSSAPVEDICLTLIDNEGEETELVYGDPIKEDDYMVLDNGKVAGGTRLIVDGDTIEQDIEDISKAEVKIDNYDGTMSSEIQTQESLKLNSVTSSEEDISMETHDITFTADFHMSASSEGIIEYNERKAMEEISTEGRMKMDIDLDMENLPFSEEFITENFVGDLDEIIIDYNDYDMSITSDILAETDLDFDPALDVFNFPIHENKEWLVPSTMDMSSAFEGEIDIEGIHNLIPDGFIENDDFSSPITLEEISQELPWFSEGEMNTPPQQMVLPLECTETTDEEVEKYIIELSDIPRNELEPSETTIPEDLPIEPHFKMMYSEDDGYIVEHDIYLGEIFEEFGIADFSMDSMDEVEARSGMREMMDEEIYGELNEYKLDVEVIGEGIVEVDGEEVEEEFFDELNETATLTVPEEYEEEFIEWRGDVPEDKENSVELSIETDENKSIRAVFDEDADDEIPGFTLLTFFVAFSLVYAVFKVKNRYK